MKYLYLFFFVSHLANSEEVSNFPNSKSLKLHADCKASIEQCKTDINFSNSNFPVYLSRGKNEIDKVVIVIHGTNRNANEYLHDFITNIKDDNLMSGIAVVAPHFLQANDPYNKNELRWNTGWENSWKYGYKSMAPIPISSYDVIDKLIKQIDNVWNPKKIIIVGHSAGGQFVQRYAHGSKIARIISSSISFVVSNPSSYLYMRDLRLIDNKWTRPVACPEFNKYIYGLNGRTEYLARFDDDNELEFNYLQNNLIYLMGNDDVLKENLDTSCEADAQGENRIIRAINFFSYLNNFFPTHKHRFIAVPDVGHDHSKIFHSQQFLDLLYEENSSDEVHKELTIKRLGAKSSITTTPKKSYFLLGGGANIDQVFIEYLKAINGGDFLILSGKDELLGYNDYLTALAEKHSIPLNSVTTVLIHYKRGALDQRLLKLISDSEGIFFTGGDQWKYIERIKDTPAHVEILKKLNSGIPFGGTSAGLAILGDVIFSAKNGTVTSDEVLKNPTDPRIALANSLFNIPLLKNIMTDSHFVIRNRMGRLISFMARANSLKLQGFGIDQDIAIVVNADGLAHVYGSGSAYLVKPRKLPVIENKLLSWKKIGINRWIAGDNFSLIDFKKPDYFLNVKSGKILSTQKNGKIY